MGGFLAVLVLALFIVFVMRARRSFGDEQKKFDAMQRDRVSGLDTAHLAELLTAPAYFDWSPADDGRTLRQDPELAPWFEGVAAGRWRELEASLGAWIERFRAAELRLGYTGQPMVTSYEPTFRSSLEVLAHRGR
jgi:hypothetical protein